MGGWRRGRVSRRRQSLGLLVPAVVLSACSVTAQRATPTTTSASVPVTTPTEAPTTTNTAGQVASINDEATLGISSTDLSVGEQVTVTGNDCPPGYWGTATLNYGTNAPLIFDGGGTEDDEGFTTANGDEAGGTADAHGLWTMVAAVPMVAPGALILNGFCTANQNDDNDLTSDFRYRSVPVMVTTPYRLEVHPASPVEPGTSVTVNLVGGPCPDAGAEVILYSGSGTQVASPEDSTTAAGAAQVLVIPTGLAPGQYQLEADCSDHMAVYGSSAPVPVTVR